MTLAQQLNKLPEHLKKTPEYTTLLSFARKNAITTTLHLSHQLRAEIAAANQELHTLNSSPTNNRKRSTLAKKINFLKTIQEKILPYL